MRLEISSFVLCCTKDLMEVIQTWTLEKGIKEVA